MRQSHGRILFGRVPIGQRAAAIEGRIEVLHLNPESVDHLPRHQRGFRLERPTEFPARTLDFVSPPWETDGNNLKVNDLFGGGVGQISPGNVATRT